MSYCLRVGFLMMIGFLPATLYGQQITATDTAEIQEKALRHVRQFEGLLNVMSQSDEYFRKYSFDRLIRNYYSEGSNYQIFRDSLVVVEDDLNPKSTTAGYGNLLTIKDYLQAFFSLYEKSPPPSVVFSNYEVSKVMQDEFLYVEVFYDSKFRNKHRAYPDLTYPTRRRKVTVKAEPQATGWRVTITDMGYAQPGDSRPPSAVASGRDAANDPAEATRQTEDDRPDSTAATEPSLRPAGDEDEAAAQTNAEPGPSNAASNSFGSTRRVYRKGKTYSLPVQINNSVPPTSLGLYLGSDQVRDLSGSLADSTFSWQIPAELPADDNYQLRLYDPVSEEIIESSTFAIKRKSRWPWIVGGIGAAAVIYAIISSRDEGGITIGGDDELPAPPPPE